MKNAKIIRHAVYKTRHGKACDVRTRLFTSLNRQTAWNFVIKKMFENTDPNVSYEVTPIVEEV